MRFLVLMLLGLLGLLVQESSARVRNFTSPDLKGLSTVSLEVQKDGTEQLIGLWKYQRTYWVSGGVVVLKIVDDQLLKVWEDNNSLAHVQGYDSADINKDGNLDFVVSSYGYTGSERNYRGFLTFYLSDEENQFRKQLIPFHNAPYHVALGDTDGDQQDDVVFTEQFDSHPDSEGCSWLELEVKIGRWLNGDFQVKGTGIYLRSGDDWSKFTLGDVDKDGKAELLIYNYSNWEPHRSITIYNLNGETTPAWVIPRPRTEDTPTISVNQRGQIIELEKGSIEPTILDIYGSLSKIAPIEIPEIDLGDWNPAQVSGLTEPTTLILSQPNKKGDLSRQVTIYENSN